MEIDASIYILINLLLKVILWSLIISSPAIILTLEMYGYERFLKWKDKTVKEKEKIILGRAKEITKQDEELERQANERKKLELDLELLNKRIKSKQEELGLDIKEEIKGGDDEEIKKDYKDMTIKELKQIAKSKGVKMYSKKNKKQLLNILNNWET